MERAGFVIVVPIRAFALGKVRLAGLLDGPARAALARELAGRVVAAAGSHPVVVVSSDPDVVAWTVARGRQVLPDPGNLDAAAESGLRWARSHGYARVVIAHGDLPLARTFDRVAADVSRPTMSIVPCHRDDGTPVLSLPSDVPFAFSYGPGSFRRHVTEATRLGLGVRVLRDPNLAFDVDVPADLAWLASEDVA
ncbi:MAG: 2-phospho-L-lactate guanylyltransferase [Acidimicrobiia bacterium]